MLWNARGGRPGLRRVRDPGALPGGDEVTSPSAVEVEHADWTHLKAFATDLGLSPRGRSGFVRQRVLDHLREHAAPLGWRAGKATQAALLPRIGPAALGAGLWEPAVPLTPPAAWVGLGTAYLKSERIEEALKCYDRAIAMGDASARLHKAQALMSAGKADRAMAEIEKTLGGSPANLRAWSMRVAIAEARRDSEETIASYRKISDLGRGRLGLAKILMRAGRFEEAEASLAAHLSDHPEDAVAWNNRGVGFAKRTQWKEAGYAETDRATGEARREADEDIEGEEVCGPEEGPSAEEGTNVSWSLSRGNVQARVGNRVACSSSTRSASPACSPTGGRCTRK